MSEVHFSSAACLKPIVSNLQAVKLVFLKIAVPAREDRCMLRGRAGVTQARACLKIVLRKHHTQFPSFWSPSCRSQEESVVATSDAGIEALRRSRRWAVDLDPSMSSPETGFASSSAHFHPYSHDIQHRSHKRMDRDGWKRIIPKGRWIIIQSGLHYHNTPFCTYMTKSPRLDERRGENKFNLPLCWENCHNWTRVVDWQLPASSTKTAKKVFAIWW